ncbi:MAG: cation transporter [Lachnospiraceae bacterium]|nr:cation transporter [Lachnospiraceae bacterium]
MLQKWIKKGGKKDIAMWISFVSMGFNMILAVMKLAAGIMAGSDALISDAVHSASDVIATLIVIIGIILSSKEADREHPYGHERLECIAAMILGGIIFMTGTGIGWEGIQKVAAVTRGREVEIPRTAALVTAITAILVKEWMYRFTAKAADMIHSAALRADAWHNRADGLASLAAFIGIGGAMLGFPVMDGAACIVISFCVLKAAWEILRDAVSKTIDQSCDGIMESEMKALIMEQKGVKGITGLHTRLFGSRIYVDAEIQADGAISLEKAHEIAETIHLSIEENFPEVKHCMVHMDPYCDMSLDK